jgi:hypothetical protein
MKHLNGGTFLELFSEARSFYSVATLQFPLCRRETAAPCLLRTPTWCFGITVLPTSDSSIWTQCLMSPSMTYRDIFRMLHSMTCMMRRLKYSLTLLLRLILGRQMWQPNWWKTFLRRTQHWMESVRTCVMTEPILEMRLRISRRIRCQTLRTMPHDARPTISAGALAQLAMSQVPCWSSPARRSRPVPAIVTAMLVSTANSFGALAVSTRDILAWRRSVVLFAQDSVMRVLRVLRVWFREGNVSCPTSRWCRPPPPGSMVTRLTQCGGTSVGR